MKKWFRFKKVKKDSVDGRLWVITRKDKIEQVTCHSILYVNKDFDTDFVSPDDFFETEKKAIQALIARKEAEIAKLRGEVE